MDDGAFKTFSAQWDGECRFCGRWFDAGDEIGMTDDGPVCRSCIDELRED